MSADDRKRLKGQILKILESKGGIPVGDIRPVNKRLRELMKAHKSDLSAEELELLEVLSREPSHPSKCVDARVPSEGKPNAGADAPKEANGEVAPKACPPSMLKFFGMEMPYIPGKGIRVSDGDKPAPSGFQPYRPPMNPEIERELDNFPLDQDGKKEEPTIRRTVSAEDLAKRRVPERLDGVQRDTDMSEELKKALDSITYGKPTPTNPAFRKILEKMRKMYGGTPFRRTYAPPSVFDPRTGQPGFSYGDKFRDPPPQHVMKEVQDMLDKDKRLTEEDKKAVISNIFHDAYWISPIFRMRPPHESLGDRVRQEVERHLARKADAPKTTLQIDPEAAVRILREFCSDMAVLEQQKKEGWLSPVVDEVNRTEVNGWSLPTMKTVQIYWHTEAEVLESVRVIPVSKLDDPISGGMTVRELLKEVARSSSFESVKDAAMEKLQ